ncbi:MAG TPA: alpha-amylase family glycosyl hydrolase [Candidatus Sulfotelmatobacter sp.]|nr:alpha-amylase family glycosyl hydrolase [Candidatus Sulfotelmatobacter sp.]
MKRPRYPSLLQINTRVWLAARSRILGRAATLDDVPDAELDSITSLGFDWVWLLSVWRTGPAGRKVAREHAGWRREFQATLPDLREDDIGGSGFAVAGYTVAEPLGGGPALARMRERLGSRGIRLMLDFVPNHTALDHPWVESHPEYYVRGSELDLAREPRNYVWVKRAGGDQLLAHGRDPNFPGWPDTLQLDYANPETQTAMRGELLEIAGQCDGVRCDMAMLVLPEVFERTWGARAQPFWPEAIRAVRERAPGFCLMAEAYWDLEWTLQQQGFDYTYDKRLYDRLRAGVARPVREHLMAELDYQNKLARFLENHDEPRAAATFASGQHQAAALITFLAPGMRFLHQGQLEGRTVRISPHLIRAPEEPTNQELNHFYLRLLDLLRRPLVREGRWRLLECAPAWEGNWTWDCFVAFAWEGESAERLIVAVNYSDHASQCLARLPFGDLAGRRWRLSDTLSDSVRDRDGEVLAGRGLDLELPAWGFSAPRLEAIR